jgi:hypothetical protein
MPEDGAPGADGTNDQSLAIGDDELTALALSADLRQPLAADAVPIDLYLGREPGSLPVWYMPPVMAKRSGRARRLVIYATVGAFVVIEAFGLCSTYGQLPFR